MGRRAVGPALPEPHEARRILNVQTVRAFRPACHEATKNTTFEAERPGLRPHSRRRLATRLLAYEKALYLDELSDAAIAVPVGEHVPKKRSPLSFCPTFTLNGVYQGLDNTTTAFGGSRSAGYVFNIEGAAPDRDGYEADRLRVRNFWDAMRPHATGAGAEDHGLHALTSTSRSACA